MYTHKAEGSTYHVYYNNYVHDTENRTGTYIMQEYTYMYTQDLARNSILVCRICSTESLRGVRTSNDAH